MPENFWRHLFNLQKMMIEVGGVPKFGFICKLISVKAFSEYPYFRNAKVDYLIQKQNDIVPLEVKSGTKGSMNSMYLFLNEKKAKYGCRLSLENLAEYDNIKVYPLYAVKNALV